MLVNGPFVSYSMDKLIYLIKSSEENCCAKLLILPYLHSKKVKMIAQKPNTRYFYTTVARNISCPDQKTKDHLNDPKLYRSIVSNNISESKFYIFSKKGILRNRIDYNDMTLIYGEIVAISPDGLKYVLRNDKEKNKPFIQIFEL